MKRAAAGYRAWHEAGAVARADALLGAAAWLRERRLELAALEVRECAKPWVEADADVCEAIDFLEYYARGAIELERGRDLLQVLRGLGDELQDALASRGFRVRTYCPVGDLVAGMAYLVRRLLENTSNDSFLSAQAAGTPLEVLLAAP